ncbi:MAG: TolC family protein, partial [Psychrilyobacter sp.]|nr:TolC family protein [Psychrilyobacter sp.]
VEASNNYTYNDKNKDHSRISIMAEWNIFRWGADSDTVEQKKISVEQSKLLQIKIRQDAHMELKGKYDNIKRIKSEQKTQKYLLQASREKFERADVRYKNNQITYSEYINILNFLQSNENRYYELKQEFIQAIDDYKNREE